MNLIFNLEGKAASAVWWKCPLSSKWEESDPEYSKKSSLRKHVGEKRQQSYLNNRHCQYLRLQMNEKEAERSQRPSYRAAQYCLLDDQHQETEGEEVLELLQAHMRPERQTQIWHSITHQRLAGDDGLSLNGYKQHFKSAPAMARSSPVMSQAFMWTGSRL